MALGEGREVFGGLGLRVGGEAVADSLVRRELEVGDADVAPVIGTALNVLGYRDVGGFPGDGVRQRDVLDVVGVRVGDIAPITRP